MYRTQSIHTHYEFILADNPRLVEMTNTFIEKRGAANCTQIPFLW
jgi:hypothetical protein